MPQPALRQDPLQRAVADLVITEMLFVHATLESATVIGDGLQQLGRHLLASPSDPDQPVGSIAALLQDTADRALEPYSSRWRYLRRLRDL